MTDKVQKIREEVERLKLCTMDEHMKFYSECAEAEYNALCKVEEIADSLQEEPVSIWHDSNEEQPEGYRTVVVWNHSTMDGEVLTRCAEVYKGRIWAYIEDLLNLSNVQRTTKNWEEPVSEDLENAVNAYIGYAPEVDESSSVYGKRQAFKAGAKWQEEKDNEEKVLTYKHGFNDCKEQMMKNIWKPADGDDLPEIDREVIVLVKYNAQHNIHDEEYPTYRVGFGHRPNPNGWDGKNIDTNEVTHYTPKLYDKGGWNAPDIAYWLDIELPKEIEL